jgi:hypothetical protein
MSLWAGQSESDFVTGHGADWVTNSVRLKSGVSRVDETEAIEMRTDHCVSKLAKIRQRLPFEVGGRAFSLREQLTAACDQATTPAKNSRKHLDFDRLRS